MSQFSFLCECVGIATHEQVEAAALYFHQSGILAYFPADPGVPLLVVSHCSHLLTVQLKNLIILDPNWIVKMMASLFTTKHTFLRHGLLFHIDLEQVPPPPPPPPNPPPRCWTWCSEPDAR